MFHPNNKIMCMGLVKSVLLLLPAVQAWDFARQLAPPTNITSSPSTNKGPQVKFYTAGGGCDDRCEPVYKFAWTCGYKEADSELDGDCLCGPNNFREQGPACIDCLIRGGLDADYRKALFNAYDMCTNVLRKPACPVSCQGVPDLIDHCKAEDAARTVTSTSTYTPRGTGVQANPSIVATPLSTSTLGPRVPTDPRDILNTVPMGTNIQYKTPRPRGTGGDAFLNAYNGTVNQDQNGAVAVMPVAIQKKVVYDPNRCICRQENADKVNACFNCLNDWDGTQAQNIVVSLNKCAAGPPPQAIKTEPISSTSTVSSSSDSTPTEKNRSAGSPTSPEKEESSNTSDGFKTTPLGFLSYFIGILGVLYGI